MVKARKLVRRYQQTIEGNIKEVFKLLCPVREKEWLQGWDYKMIFSEGGYAEKGCVFETSNAYGSYHWIISRHDEESYVVQFVKTMKDIIVLIDIQLYEADAKVTLCDIQYSFIALKEEAVEAMHKENTEAIFCSHMKKWEDSLNYYLKHNTMLIS